ncbi:MAG: galactokinase [Armatimonadetes bacterium]|nr:galactokinase [Armatimonadota bacterium]
MIDRAEIASQYQQLFGGEPRFWVRAPGRVNLIGEHTDYNDGFVLPAAIEREMVLAVGPRDDRMTLLRSLDYPHAVEFDLAEEIERAPEDPWGNYARGVAWALKEAGYALNGFHGVGQGDVPIGSGLSSSAAIEVAVALAYQAVTGFEMDGVTAAKLCQRAENAFVGVNSGIMDQFISRNAEAGHALLIDCRSLDYRPIPLDTSDAKIVIADTAKRRGLVDSEYNARRAECETAVRILGEHLPGITALRDVSVEQFNGLAERLPEITRKRARHVITENDRVLRAVDLLASGDLQGFGELMNESHRSLRDDYEVSGKELDAMVELAWKQPGVLGSRMTGAGFGGCTVSLLRSDSVEDFCREVPKQYQAQTGLEPSLYVTEAAPGAEISSQ